MTQDPRDGRCAGRRRRERHLHVPLERRVGHAIPGATEERLRRLGEAELHVLRPDDGPRRHDLGAALGPLPRAEQRPPERHAGGLAGRKALPDEVHALADLDLARRQVEHLHELGRRLATARPPAGDQPGHAEGEQDGRQPAKESHRPTNGRTRRGGRAK